MSDGSMPPPMKLLFVILAHDRPGDAAGLARTLVAAGSDARALIHFDARADAASFAALEAAVAGEPRIGLVARRAACRWGSFGLVEAPLNALAQAEAEFEASGWTPDYAILLSGACLPCRPVASLEQFLAAHPGRQYIESEDESWVTGGWRSERWRFWHVFDHKTQRPLEWLSGRVQGALRVRRRFPAGLRPRFGSQWWALTWPVCQAILADIRRNPARLRFFRRAWIPDEMVFQTYVDALVPRESIAGFGLTHFQFTTVHGRPVMFYDDHVDYVRDIDRFFFRKASPEALRLRAASLAQAGAPDDGRGFDRVGERREHYFLKLQAQTHYSPPGALFFRDQFSDHSASVLGAAGDPYLVVVGPPAMARRLVARLPEPPFTAFGEIFAPASVDLGPGRAAIGGLRRSDTAIRDAHPALFLTRLRTRAGGVPAFAWSPADRPWLLAAVLRDPAALVITLPVLSGNPAQDRETLLAQCLGPGRARLVDVPFGLPRDWVQAALNDIRAPWSPDLGYWLVSGVTPVALEAPDAPRLRPPDLALPWGGDPGPETLARRRSELERALALCRFRDAAWFPALAAALQAWDPDAPEPPPAARAAKPGERLAAAAPAPLTEPLTAPEPALPAGAEAR